MIKDNYFVFQTPKHVKLDSSNAKKVATVSLPSRAVMASMIVMMSLMNKNVVLKVSISLDYNIDNFKRKTSCTFYCNFYYYYY